LVSSVLGGFVFFIKKIDFKPHKMSPDSKACCMVASYVFFVVEHFQTHVPVALLHLMYSLLWNIFETCLDIN